ncbi:hypothetical protein CS022_20045 [Veronia nyctiphanis]|uniref:Syntaxin-5 N-terminal Sly1p-binding domain-containing protein n=1 Tax=Veronia nyctiphanis TaxID=1278244 RepID=A0A4V1LSH9_9GAMM|nr:hypothetical protein CS022_20045 [Veronia nyctiphanis]
MTNEFHSILLQWQKRW